MVSQKKFQKLKQDFSSCSIPAIDTKILNFFQSGSIEDRTIETDTKPFSNAALATDANRAFHVPFQ